ncbi:MFS transporter [Halosegnis marinus]|uniref:MFS transporter n=1 Tax=Halosegnis marinus TaxID=3034023 RepID=A0ABD5ZM15_9EURY|nr:MFS transporter [Halosegnis sp. DT85]
MADARIRDAFLAVARDRERAGLLVAYLLLFVVVDAYGQLLPLYYRELGVSVAALGVAKSVGNGVEAVASGPVGVLADETDRAAIAVVAGGALAVVLAAFPFAGGALALGALVVAFAAARLVFNTAATPLLSASFETGAEGVGWAVRDTAIYVGGALGVAGTGLLVARLGYGSAFLALVPALVALVAVLAVAHRPTFGGAVSLPSLSRPRPLAAVRAVSKPGVLARFLAVKLFAGLGMGSCFYLLPVRAVDLGVAAGTFLLAFGAAKVVAVAFTLLGGLATDRVSRKALYVGNFAIEAVMLAALALADSPALLFVAVGLYVLQTTFEPAVLAFFFDQFDEEESGRAWGISGVVARGTGVVAPAVGGYLYRVSPSLAFGLGAAAMVAATAAALTLPGDPARA